jgi:hypothetical protein
MTFFGDKIQEMVVFVDFSKIGWISRKSTVGMKTE